MNDRKEGLRAAAALCCRSLYMSDPITQRIFILKNGASLLIRLLDSFDSVTIFETTLNLEDLLLDGNNIVQQDVKDHLLKLGIL